ncbi:ABC transporter substrate-binding protein [Vibrio maritimus]|uniref:ABC transporter substrate-binding protein n=1 Tax=Vibrio maritimus TaxID=990268 RepID=UPI004068E531
MTKLRALGVSIAFALSASYVHAETVTLDVTAWKGNEAEPAGMPELLDKFHKENPDIKVKLSYISRGDTDLVIPPRLQGGKNAPDVMMVDMPLVKTWGEVGLLKDLGTDSEWYANTTPSIKESLTVNGGLYVQPLELVGLGNFVNLDLLAQAGVDKVPHTVDELLVACQKLDAEGIKPMLFAPELSGLMFVVTNGVRNGEVKPWELGDGRASFVDDKGFNKSFDLVRDLIDAKCFEPRLQAGLDPWTTSLTEFRSGNVAMLPQGAWNIVSFKQQEGLNFVFAPMPADVETGVALDTFGMGWAISSATKHEEAARKFLDFFAKDENLSVMLKADSGYNPYVGGTNGLPELAASYDSARDAGNIVMWPVFMNHWPSTMQPAAIDGVATFLLNPKISNSDILEVWDETVEDSM